MNRRLITLGPARGSGPARSDGWLRIERRRQHQRQRRLLRWLLRRRLLRRLPRILVRRRRRRRNPTTGRPARAAHDPPRAAAGLTPVNEPASHAHSVVAAGFAADAALSSSRQVTHGSVSAPAVTGRSLTRGFGGETGSRVHVVPRLTRRLQGSVQVPASTQHRRAKTLGPSRCVPLLGGARGFRARDDLTTALHLEIEGARLPVRGQTRCGECHRRRRGPIDERSLQPTRGFRNRLCRMRRPHGRQQFLRRCADRRVAVPAFDLYVQAPHLPIDVQRVSGIGAREFGDDAIELDLRILELRRLFVPGDFLRGPAPALRQGVAGAQITAQCKQASARIWNRSQTCLRPWDRAPRRSLPHRQGAWNRHLPGSGPRMRRAARLQLRRLTGGPAACTFAT